MSKASAFVAYPGKPVHISQCISEAVEIANNSRPDLTFSTWEENDIAGRPLTAPIFEGIRDSILLVADITLLNFNVIYEVGFSIGRNKRVFLIRNSTISSDEELARRVGVFDTLGYSGYENPSALASLLKKANDFSPLRTDFPHDQNAPLYVLETPQRNQAMTRIIARIKKARLRYRSFTPSEETRLSAIDAIKHVSSSHGIVVPLLPPTAVDADVHNLRAAFVAGLAHGMNKATLILQDQDGLVPLDVRDFVKRYSHPDDINAHVEDFAPDVVEAIQATYPTPKQSENFLARIVMGDPMAENEFTTLGNYYLQTDEFNRALRGEVNLVVGRKGTGKTALFAQVRDHIRKNKQNIVVDLKPEGYQLIKLKEEVLDYLSEGAKAHLITAFWEYLLLLEVCYKVLEKDQNRYMRDHELYDPYLKLREAYLEDSDISEGDFSERLQRLSERIIQNYKAKFKLNSNVRLDFDDITQMLYAHDLRRLTDDLSEYLEFKESVWILFDNLDKGWSPQGLAEGDIIIVRCLIDASRKLQRQLNRMGHAFHSIVFIRNDVYQLLMDYTPDFGKEMRASLDWSDPDLLREMLRKRLLQNDVAQDSKFDQLWALICDSHYKGEETSQYFIDRCLMRPRNLLKIFSHCKGFAVNLDHRKISSDDITKGLESYSNDMIVDADQELTDIEPTAASLIYQFIGEPSQFKDETLHRLFAVNRIDAEKYDSVKEFLLYYGFIGVLLKPDEPRYIFDFGYDMKKLNTFILKNTNSVSYVLNPAFWPGLEIN